MSTPPTIAHAIIMIRVCFEVVFPDEERSAGETGVVEALDENDGDSEEGGP